MIRVENASEETAGENVCSVHTYATTENLAISLLTSCTLAFLREPAWCYFDQFPDILDDARGILYERFRSKINDIISMDSPLIWNLMKREDILKILRCKE